MAQLFSLGVISTRMKICKQSKSHAEAFSILRVLLMVVGIIAIIPLTVLFGIFGFFGCLFVLLLIAFAKA